MDENGRKRRLSEVESHEHFDESAGQEIELQISNFALQHGFESIEEFTQMLAMGDQAIENMGQQVRRNEVRQQTTHLNSLFIKHLEGSAESRVSRIIDKLDEGIDDAEILNLKIARDNFVDLAKQTLDGMVDSTDRNKHSYLLSLAATTIVKASHCLSVFFEFLESSYGKNKGYGVDKLKALPQDLRVPRISNLFSDFASFFCESYKVTAGIAKLKGSENVEPSTIVSYTCGLFIAFKILGVIDIGMAKKQLFGTKFYIETRKALRTLGAKNYLFKEKISAIDIVECLKRTKIENIVDLQCAVFCLLMPESGLRNTSTLARLQDINGFAGLKLSDITFQFTRHKEFRVAILVRHEKTNTKKEGNRRIFLYSNARYCHLSAANLLLAFICLCGYTTKTLVECLQIESVELRPECRNLPLFCEIKNDLILTGVPLKRTEKIMSWLSEKTRIPSCLLAVNSFRKGHAMALYENAYLLNSNLTESEAISKVISAGTWTTRVCKKYFSHLIGPRLLSFRVYGLSLKNAIADLIFENLNCGIFLSDKFQSTKVTQERLNEYEQAFKMKYEREVTVLKETSIDYQKCKRIKDQHNITENAPFYKTKGMTNEVVQEYKVAMKSYDKARRKLYGNMYTNYKNKIKQLECDNWYKAKMEIKLNGRYLPVKEDYPSALDFDLLQQTFKHFVLPSPFGPLPFSRDTDYTQVEPIKCPFSINTCQVKLQTPMDFVTHRAEHESLLRQNQKLEWYCHTKKCDHKSIPMKEHDYLLHVASAHPSIFICSCDQQITLSDQASHQRMGHFLQEHSWIFEPFLFPAINDRCECANVIDMPSNLQCICHQDDILIEISETTLNALIQLGLGPNTSNPKQDLARSILSNKLKLETLPVCLIKIISKI